MKDRVKKKKPTIAIVSLTCCEGCQVAVMDLGERFLKLINHLVIGDFSFVQEHASAKKFDITFIEGAPITKENIASLKKIRKNTRYLVPIGACACLGGIAEIKNYLDKENVIKYVYPHTQIGHYFSPNAGKSQKDPYGGVGVYRNIELINNPDIKPVSAYVPADLEIPGCPINKEEFFILAKKLISFISAGQPISNIKIPQRPVCYECQLKENRCLLQNNQPCFGPIMLGGCNAPCPTSGYPCDGCRGPLREPIATENLKKILAKNFSGREVDKILERFGVLDQLEEKLKN